MTLDEYLRAGSDTAEKLAGRIPTTEASISRIRNGKQNATLDLAAAIERETKGLVTIAELVASRKQAAA